MTPDSPTMQRLLPISPGRRQNLIHDAIALAAGGCTQLILREPHRSRWELEQSLEELTQHLPGLILHATNINAWRFAEIHSTGLHLPSHLDPAKWRKRFAGRLGISCHTLEEIQKAEAAHLDYVLISPIFSPISKPDSREMIGPEKATEFQDQCRIKVFGLGGIHASNTLACRHLYGVASMGYLFGKQTNRKRLTSRSAKLLSLLND